MATKSSNDDGKRKRTANASRKGKLLAFKGKEAVEPLAGNAGLKRAKQKLDGQLFDAARTGDLNAAKDALGKGADANAKNNMGWSALMWAAYHGQNEMVELLIANKVDVNARNLNGGTALGAASVYKNMEVIALLRQHGAVE